jgi:serine/threonine protein kinase/cytochrome c-type biogenesis protein CcmH/NrfG
MNDPMKKKKRTPSEEIYTAPTKTIKTSSKELTTGTTLAGKFQIIEELGRGGMGIVYKAEDTRLKRTVALKFLPPELTRDTDVKDRFIQEAQAASALDHANICTIHEIDETEDGQTFICMAYYEGGTLKDKIKKGPLDTQEALDIAIQVAQGLAKVHKQGILHRDIKPANIMITSDGAAKIVDFGLAKLAGQARLTRTGTTMGTVAYMSPEQTRGDEADQRTDIWSLGVMLYEMLTGQLPFKGEHEQAVVYSILNKEPKPLTALRKQLPAALEQIIFKALSKDPQSRYSEMSGFLKDLQQVQKTPETVTLPPVTVRARPRLRRWITSPILWGLISVLVIIIVSLLLFYPAGAIPFEEGDWILITDFDNLTGEEVFDKSLNTALSVSIQQSRYLNVLPRRRIDEALRRMKKEDIEHIDEAIGREIAEREGIKVILVPSISRVGDTYVLTGMIENPNTGKSYRSELVRSPSKNEVLYSLDELSEKIRQDLGETLASISQQSKPLAEVTTSSLEALKQYSLGIENHRKAKFEEAKVYYENALRIDPAFTAAKSSLGILNFERFDREQGKMLLAEAVKDVDGLTDREKYSILAFYAVSVKNNPQEAVEHTKARLALYPGDSAAHNNLGRYYEQMGRFEDAIAEYKETLRIDPYLMLTYNGLINLYLRKKGDLDSALEWCERQLSYDDKHIWAYNNLAWIYLGKDDLEKAKAAGEKALENNPRFVWGLFSLGHVHRQRGRYEDALRSLKKILEINPEEPYAAYQVGHLYQLMGDDKSAHPYFEKYHKQAEKWVQENPNHAYSLISLGLALTRLGQKKQGWAVGQKGMKLEPNGYFGNAQLLSVHGKIQEAIGQLELLIEKGYGNYVWIKIHPDFQPLYDEPRFKEMIRQGLKQ